MKELKLIMASDPFGLVGVNDRLPWHIPEELKLFKQITNGGVVIMGRNTFMGLPKFPLPNRVNVVMSRKFVGVTKEEIDGATVFYIESMDMLDDALLPYRDHDWYVIGGPSLWDAALATGRVTEVHQSMMHFTLHLGKDAVYYDTLYQLAEAGLIGLETIEFRDQFKFAYSRMKLTYEECPSAFIFDKPTAKRVLQQ